MKRIFTAEEKPDVLAESTAKTEFEFEKCFIRSPESSEIASSDPFETKNKGLLK